MLKPWKILRNTRFVATALISTLLLGTATSEATAEEETVTASVVTQPLLTSKFLATAHSEPLNNAGIIIQDLATKELVYQSDSATLRAPASVLKLISMTATLTAMDRNTQFKTTLYQTDKPNKFLLIGESDPWLTTSIASAKKFHRGYLPYLINKIRLAHPKLKAIQLDYANVFAFDLVTIKKFYGRKFKIYPKKLSSVQAAIAESREVMGSISSPPLSEIVKFTTLWSDNALANRLAYLSAAKLGYPQSANGVQSAFTDVLHRIGISTEGMVVRDGNGLSHETRVSVKMINDVLLAIRGNPVYQPIYEGLPQSGKTGTLRRRFKKDAPSAIGLVRAKTGWIKSTVSLAGYLTAGEKEYAFTIINSGLPDKEPVRARARILIDRLLAALVP